MDNLYLNRMNSLQGILKKEKKLPFKYQWVRHIIIKFFQRYDIGMHLFFLTIPKPLKQHPI